MKAPPFIICLFFVIIYELKLTHAPTTISDDMLLQLIPPELLGVMDALPPLVRHEVTCDESLSIRLSHLSQSAFS